MPRSPRWLAQPARGRHTGTRLRRCTSRPSRSGRAAALGRAIIAGRSARPARRSLAVGAGAPRSGAPARRDRPPSYALFLRLAALLLLTLKTPESHARKAAIMTGLTRWRGLGRLRLPQDLLFLVL